MMNTKFDAVVIGGGHNGLTTANYLAMGGMTVCVLEKRHVVGALMAKQWLPEPPRLHAGGLGDLLEAVKLGLDVYKLDEDTRWRLLQFFIGAPQSIIDRWFDSDKGKAMVAAHIMPANYAPLYQPGASLAMLHHAVGEVGGRKGAWGLVRRGMEPSPRQWRHLLATKAFIFEPMPMLSK